MNNTDKTEALIQEYKDALKQIQASNSDANTGSVIHWTIPPMYPTYPQYPAAPCPGCGRCPYCGRHASPAYPTYQPGPIWVSTPTYTAQHPSVFMQPGEYR